MDIEPATVTNVVCVSVTVHVSVNISCWEQTDVGHLMVVRKSYVLLLSFFNHYTNPHPACTVAQQQEVWS